MDGWRLVANEDHRCFWFWSVPIFLVIDLFLLGKSHISIDHEICWITWIHTDCNFCALAINLNHERRNSPINFKIRLKSVIMLNGLILYIKISYVSLILPADGVTNTESSFSAHMIYAIVFFVMNTLLQFILFTLLISETLIWSSSASWR